jgi:hypothetical protein
MTILCQFSSHHGWRPSILNRMWFPPGSIVTSPRRTINDESYKAKMHRRIVIYTSIISHTRRTASSSAKSTSYVVSTPPKNTSRPIPDDRIVQPNQDLPSSAFPSSSSATMYEHFPAADQEAVDRMKAAQSRPSSTASTPAHPGTTQDGLGRAGNLPKNEEGIGSSSAVRFRSAPGEMNQGSDGGLGLMKDGKKAEGSS